MKLYRKPGSPFWWHDFYFEGKRYRASTGEKTKAAAGTMAAAALTRLTEGSTITKRGHKAPTLREFSKRFLTWTQNSGTIKPNTRRYYELWMAAFVLLGACLNAHRPNHRGND